jgi:multidrug resistance efflux pump
MKKGLVLVSILIVFVVLGGGWWWAQNSPEQAAQFLIDGGLEASRAEAFVTSIGGQIEGEEEEFLVASGSIEGDEVSIVSEFGGRIVDLTAQEGDQVKQDQILVQLDTSSLIAQLAQAEAAVGAAQANVANVKAGVHPGEILAAAALVLQAEAERDAAWSAVEDARTLLDNPQAVEAQIVEARAAVDLAQTQIELAKAKIAQAETLRHPYRGQGSMEEKGLYRVYDYQVQAAQVGLDAARADKAGAEKTLAALKALRDNPLAIASQVALAEASAQIADAGVGVAEAQVAELEAGPAAEDVAVAEALVLQAQAGVSVLESQLEKMILRAPISGLVTSSSAHAGEAALPGATLLTLANLDQVHLTIYVPEDELNRVHLGQTVGVSVDSFPTEVFTGTVSHIAQQAEFTPKNVQTEKDRVNMVFAVKVELPNPGYRLKPGMPADAILHAGH